MWSKDERTHREMVAAIQEVASLDDERTRWKRALGYIASSSAYYAEPAERVGSWCSTLAMAAFYPSDYRSK